MTAILDELAEGHGTSVRWRDVVVRYLRTDGHQVGRPLLPDGGAWTDHAEIEGVPGWSILCRRQKRLDLPSSLDKAADHAARHGNTRSATVLHRRARPGQDHDVASAYVLLSLSTFSKLLKELSSTAGAHR